MEIERRSARPTNDKKLLRDTATGVALGFAFFQVLVWVTFWRIDLSSADQQLTKRIVFGLNASIAVAFIVSWVVRTDRAGRRAAAGFAVTAASLVLQWIASVTPRHAHIEAFGQVLISWFIWAFVHAWPFRERWGQHQPQQRISTPDIVFGFAWLLPILGLWLWITMPNLTSGIGVLLALPTVATFWSGSKRSRRRRAPWFAVTALATAAYAVHTPLVEYHYRKVSESRPLNLVGPFRNGPQLVRGAVETLTCEPWKGAKAIRLDGDGIPGVYLLFLPQLKSNGSEVGAKVKKPTGSKIANRWYLVRGYLGTLTPTGYTDSGRC